MPIQNNRWRYTLLGMSIVFLLMVFIFQRLDVASFFFDGLGGMQKFLINRSVRYVINDLLMILLIYALFNNRQYIVFALYVQLAGIVLFLIPYFILKAYYPAYNGPLISFLHRLVINPLLLSLLIPAFYYQQRQGR